MTLTVLAVHRPLSYPHRVTAFTQPYWDALVQGCWSTTRCGACGEQTFPPKVVCPHCWSRHMRWVPLAGCGTLYSWTRVHVAPTAFGAETPYVLALVDLECGLRVAMRCLEPVPEPGLPIEVVVLLYKDGPLLACRAPVKALD